VGGLGPIRLPGTVDARRRGHAWPVSASHPSPADRPRKTLSPAVGLVVAFGHGVGRFPPWTRTRIRPPPPSEPADRPPDDLAALAAALDRLAAQDLDRLPDPARAERVLVLRRLVDRHEGQWLKELAGVDAHGAAGAEHDQQVGSTAGWLRTRLRLSPGSAASSVRTARAVFRGPLPQTAAALTTGELSSAHAAVVASGTHDLPDHVRIDADSVLVAAARRLDRPGAPAGGWASAAGRRPRRRRRRRPATPRPPRAVADPTIDQLVAIDGLPEPEAGQTLLTALEPLARPADAHDTRSGSQRTADASTELARRSLEGGGLPLTGGVRPQLAVIVDLASLLGHPGAVGGDLGGLGPLEPEACRRLACDGAVTRVLVTHHQGGLQNPGGPPDGPDDLSGQPSGHHRTGPPDDQNGRTGHPHPGCCPSPDAGPMTVDLGTAERSDGLATTLRAAMALLPPTLGGAPCQPLDVGPATRVVTPAQRTALAVRDGGCSFPGCSRPLGWCDAHHLRHWVDGGPTDLANLVLLCRAHHRAVHEGR
jgi:Domain of unknown function (DUF222)/HNH endonuclease